MTTRNLEWRGQGQERLSRGAVLNWGALEHLYKNAAFRSVCMFLEGEGP